MEKLSSDKTIGNIEEKKNLSIEAVVSKIQAIFERYYATIAEKERYKKRGPSQDNWKDPNFDIEEKLKSVKGPLIEVAGPTEEGYCLIDTNLLGKKIHASNLYEGCPIIEDGKVINYFGKVDFRADARKLPFQEGKIGAVFCSCLGRINDEKVDLFTHRAENVSLKKKTIEEAMRVLEPGGVIVWQNSNLEDMSMAESIGFRIVQKIVDVDVNRQVSCSFVGEKSQEGDER